MSHISRLVDNASLKIGILKHYDVIIIYFWSHGSQPLHCDLAVRFRCRQRVLARKSDDCEIIHLHKLAGLRFNMLLSKWHGVDVLFLCTPTCGHLFASEWGPLARFWCWPVIYYRGNAFESLNISYVSLLCVRLLFCACECPCPSACLRNSGHCCCSY